MRKSTAAELRRRAEANLAARDAAAVPIRRSGPFRWPDPHRGPWVIVLAWGQVEGRTACVGLEVRSFDQTGDNFGVPTTKRGLRELTTTFLRRELPLKTIIEDRRRMSRAGLASLLSMSDQPHVRVQIDDETRARLERRLHSETNKPRRGGRPPVSVTHLERVAATYAEAWEAGFSPTKAVAEQLRLPYSTAAKHVGLARKLGLLGATRKGVGGSVETPKTKRQTRGRRR